jgi:hypothetical protein
MQRSTAANQFGWMKNKKNGMVSRMANKNIQMKIKNGADWDNLYPKTKAELIEGLTDQVAALVAVEVDGKVDKVAGKQLSTEDYTSADKTKLAGIADEANNYTHPVGDGESHVPATGTTSNGKVLTAGATANSAAWVDLPSGSTSVKGIVQLSDATNSTSTTAAATANAVKTAHDLAAGKSKITVSSTEPTDADMWYQEI